METGYDLINSIIINETGMIENPRTIILFRENLTYGNRKLSFEEINIKDFKYDNNPKVPGLRMAMGSELILFIDVDGATKILKNRWGNIGIVK